MCRAGAGLLLALAAVLSGCATRNTGEAPTRPARPSESRIAPGPVARPSESRIAPGLVPPLGACRIWYAELPGERQPPFMSCGRAHEIAQRHGGRVVKAISKKSFHDGSVLSQDYGPGRFAGVPPDRLPPPGLCRAWYERAAPDRQPPPMNCDQAEKLVRENGGRLLYMPGSDLK